MNVYGNAKDVLHKTLDELKELREHGLEMVYLGAESGSDKVLQDICKGVNAEQLIEAVHKIEYAGIKASVTFISGLAGQAGWPASSCTWTNSAGTISGPSGTKL